MSLQYLFVGYLSLTGYLNMLLGSISPNIISSSAVSSSSISSSTISMVTNTGLPQYGFLVVTALIILLSLKEVLSSSERWNIYLNSSFNLAIVPLSLSFVAIIIFKIVQIIWFLTSTTLFFSLFMQASLNQILESANTWFSFLIFPLL